ncbi:MAG: hypothetical protein KC435_12945 [Thermomicrobiales bacterium]|nr:hypothetical protein [Thermomicrobiales bacterium]
MDLTRLSILLIMMLPLVVAIVGLVRVMEWRAAAQALHLRWEREQRQAGVAGITMGQRQTVQTRFEELVSTRNLAVISMMLTITLLCTIFAGFLAWELDDLEWSGLWLLVPFGIVALGMIVSAWWVHRSGTQQLAITSTSLYGPPPPRVKVRNIQPNDMG